MKLEDLPELPPEFKWSSYSGIHQVLLRADPSIRYALVYTDAPHTMIYFQDGRVGHPPTWYGEAPTAEEAVKILAMRFWLGEFT